MNKTSSKKKKSHVKTEVGGSSLLLHIFYLTTQKCKHNLIVEQNFQDIICDDLSWGGEKRWDQSNHGEESSEELM